MPIQGKPAADVSENPYLPAGPKPLLFEDFQGMNTSALRAGVPDEQCYWIDGFMPIAPRNLRTLYGVGGTFYAPGGGLTIVWFGFYNLGTTPYMVVFLSDGSVKQIRTTDGAVTNIMAAAGITSPSIVTVGISQWGRDYLIIVSDQTNGYWLWNGASLFAAGALSPEVEILSNGAGYPASVTIAAVGGSGTGTSLTASVFGGVIQSVSIVAPGTGYSVYDVVTGVITPAPSVGTGASIVAFVATGTLTSMSIVSGGSGYSSNPSITFSLDLGLGGSPNYPIARAIVTSGSITNTSILAVGSGLTSAPTVVITDSSVYATVNLRIMPYGIQGTAVETYQNRVWVAKGPLIEFTAPGSYADFATSNGGGNFTSGDSYLRRAFLRLIQTNGFLYLIGDSSMNAISGVQTTGTPPTTTFTNSNVDPQVGSPYPASVQPFGRDIILANSFGIHISRGGSFNKISEPLDGVYNTVADFGSLQLSSAQATIFGKKVFMTLVRVVDPVSGSTVNKLFMWNGKLWWASMQDMTLIYVAHQEINSVITAWGTDGTTIKSLFNSVSAGFQKIVQSRLWDTAGGYQFTKAISRLWGMAYYHSGTGFLSIGIDTETGQMAAPYTITPGAAGYFIIPPTAVAQNGVLNGLTIKTTGDVSLISLMLANDIVAYRG